jgi:hypothetical protein
MEIFRAQLSRYIPHPHRDSWMRNSHGAWLQLLRLASSLTLLAAAWNLFKTTSPLGISGQFQPFLDQLTGKFFTEGEEHKFSKEELQLYFKIAFAAFFGIAALCCLRCGDQKKPKFILTVMLAGLFLMITAAHYCVHSEFKVIFITPFLLPIATPFLLLGYRRLANKLDHWNYYANFFCVTTIFGNALTYLFYPEMFSNLLHSLLISLGITTDYGAMALTAFSYFAIFSALLTALALTRRVGLFAVIMIGILSSIYRILSHLLDKQISISPDLIIADFFFHISYWLIPILILLSLASRRKTQTLKL